MYLLDAVQATCRSLLALQHPRPRVPSKPMRRAQSARAPFAECGHSIILVQSNAWNSAVNSLTQRSCRSFDSARAFRCMSVSGSSSKPAGREGGFENASSEGPGGGDCPHGQAHAVLQMQDPSLQSKPPRHGHHPCMQSPAQQPRERTDENAPCQAPVKLRLVVDDVHKAGPQPKADVQIREVVGDGAMQTLWSWRGLRGLERGTVGGGRRQACQDLQRSGRGLPKPPGQMQSTARTPCPRQRAFAWQSMKRLAWCCAQSSVASSMAARNMRGPLLATARDGHCGIAAAGCCAQDMGNEVPPCMPSCH